MIRRSTNENDVVDLNVRELFYGHNEDVTLMFFSPAKLKECFSLPPSSGKGSLGLKFPGKVSLVNSLQRSSEQHLSQ